MALSVGLRLKYVKALGSCVTGGRTLPMGRMVGADGLLLAPACSVGVCILCCTWTSGSWPALAVLRSMTMLPVPDAQQRSSIARLCGLRG